MSDTDICIYFSRWNGRTGSHALLEQAARQYCREEKREKSETGDFQFAQAERNSKPYFADRPDLPFSISHSGNWWVCAISGVETGLDLQEIRHKDEEKLARRFFHPDEVRWLERNGFAQFSRLWAYKESYVKYTGVGLREGLDYFSVITKGSLSGAPDVFQTQLPFQDGFVLVLTVAKEQAGAARQARIRELEAS